ncbi:MAG TPA: hypothetical protein VK625_04730, partial [Flavitalea sp.]|nr:hypothetical protein [Flavitalea sp.]
MIIGVLREPSFETRVSVLPDIASAIIKKGVQVSVENGAGEKAFAADADYALAGATILPREQVIKNADIILCMHQPASTDLEAFRSKIIIGVYQPLYQPEVA